VVQLLNLGSKEFPSACARLAAKLRSTEPARLTNLLKGDLDWILMKALEKDRNRRYETANDFAEDIRRHLESQPVVACAPSAAYVLTKMVRRHRVAFAAGAAVTLALIGGIAVSTWQWVRATRAEKSTGEEATRSQRLIYNEHMNLAKRAWDETSVGRVVELLDQHRLQPGKPDLRGLSGFTCIASVTVTVLYSR
jgi:hypothetical protein